MPPWLDGISNKYLRKRELDTLLVLVVQLILGIRSSLQPADSCSPKDVQVSMPRTCERVAFPGKGLLLGSGVSLGDLM